MRVMCLGAGALGGYFGGRLIEAGQPVTFILRERRRAQVARDGIRIESPFGDFSGPAETVSPDAIPGPADVVILACKAYDLPSAMDAIRPAVGSDTAILPILNGIAHLDALNDAFGRDHVLGGVAKIAATLTPEGVIRHLNDWRFLTFGEQDGTMSERVIALKAAFDGTSVVANAVPDILQAMWNKIVHLATVAGMTCLMRASVGEIARTPDGAELFVAFLESNAEIAKREGFPPSEAFLDDFRAMFRNPELPYTSSMLRDLESHGPVEADHILGFMRDKAAAHGLDGRMHRVVYTHLKAYEARRAAGRF